MIRNASLLKETENSELDELRAELIKQKVVFEAELRRQREVSDERFDGMKQQLQTVLDDNSNLRNTLHALGDRLAILEQQHQRQRSQSPTAFTNNNNNNADTNRQFGRNASAGGVGGSSRPRQASPLPRQVQPPQPQPSSAAAAGAPGGFSNIQFVKLRPSPSTTPRTTPRQPITRTQSQVSNMTAADSARAAKSSNPATSPAHVGFRPVLRNQQNAFRSPMRQNHLNAIGKTDISQRWR